MRGNDFYNYIYDKVRTDLNLQKRSQFYLNEACLLQCEMTILGYNLETFYSMRGCSGTGVWLKW
jgi:hypothetical protein